MIFAYFKSISSQKFVLFSALFLVLIVQQGLALGDSQDQVPAASSPRRSLVHHHQRQPEDDDGSQGPRTPYSFGYDFTDELGNRQQRTETSDERGVVQGSYSYSDADGVSRIVNYVADEHGYRASVNTNEPGVRSHSPASVYIESSAAPVDGGDGDDQTGSSSGLYPSTFVVGQDDPRGQRSASGGQRARSQRQRQQRTQQAEPVPRQQTVSGGGHQPVPQRQQQQQRVPVQPDVGVVEQEAPQRQHAAPVEVGHHRGVHHQQQQLPAIQPIVLPEILEQPVPVPQQIGQYARSQPTSSRARARHHVRQSFPLVAAAMFGANNFYEAERLHHQIE